MRRLWLCNESATVVQNPTATSESQPAVTCRWTWVFCRSSVVSASPTRTPTLTKPGATARDSRISSSCLVMLQTEGQNLPVPVETWRNPFSAPHCWEWYFAEQKGCCRHRVGDIIGELGDWISLHLTCHVSPGIQRVLGRCPSLQQYFSSTDSWKHKDLTEKVARRHRHKFFTYTVSQRFYTSKKENKNFCALSVFWRY